MITHVAIKQDGKIYSLPMPSRHHNVIHMMVEICGLKIPITGEEGFIWTDDTGRDMNFVDREIAAALAYNSGWVEVLKGKLYSEDLW